MTETPETPDTPETIVDEVDTASSTDGTPAAAEAGPQLPPKERRAKRRAAKAPGERGPRSVAERAAERREQRSRLAAQRRAYRARTKAKASELRSAAPAAEPVHATEHGPGRPKVRQGLVTSNKADKTITVRVELVRRHRRYNKILRTSAALHVHDERNDANEGDTVRVVESRPLSRTKRWRLVEVLERAK